MERGSLQQEGAQCASCSIEALLVAYSRAGEECWENRELCCAWDSVGGGKRKKVLQGWQGCVCICPHCFPVVVKCHSDHPLPFQHCPFPMFCFLPHLQELCLLAALPQGW